jgi:hypothetical protein
MVELEVNAVQHVVSVGRCQRSQALAAIQIAVGQQVTPNFEAFA